MGVGQSKSDDLAVLDENTYEVLSRYTKLKRDDILAWHERFTQQCTGNLKTMNKEQFCKFYKELRPQENVDRLSECVFRAFDLDGDHGISFTEFLIAYISTTEAPLEQKLRYAFNVYDIDKNSSIDRAEIILVLRSMFELLGMSDAPEKYSYEQCADNIMKNLDSNSDERISKEEFIQGLKNDPFLQSLMNPFQHV
ncbi:unnamed protein product [Didymodactylos carnosus]|uniref:EF-hand domain-containing protein n=1 Tax=Didymodactylos carnosus TaxID=1234261 RepID=A0A813P357_9BILA|nr:unnamed protein product [Didymodactylos carnosus]CAF1134814.1 unnamed protein product [Didymodactylos carnosus]CAF3527561.1 unnamed protein product [Didymodactylos carnosus]CAF3922315.1 unnamed protein product [Didymodactylos carnosus]